MFLRSTFRRFSPSGRMIKSPLLSLIPVEKDHTNVPQAFKSHASKDWVKPNKYQHLSFEFLSWKSFTFNFLVKKGCKCSLIFGSLNYRAHPGKNMRRDPAIPTWDPRCIPGGIPPFSRPGLWNIPGGIPPRIMEHPVWDPTRDYGTSHVGSHPGLWNILGGIPPGIWNILCGIPSGIMEHPVWDPTRDYGTSHMGSHLGLWNVPHGIPPIPLGIPPGKSYCRRDCTWDPANPSLDSA